MKRSRRKLPFLENSTACQKSTPDLKHPGRNPFGFRLVVPLKKSFRPPVLTGTGGRHLHSEDAVHHGPYSGRWCRSCVETFTESLILAQDERWRRA